LLSLTQLGVLVNSGPNYDTGFTHQEQTDLCDGSPNNLIPVSSLVGPATPGDNYDRPFLLESRECGRS